MGFFKDLRTLSKKGREIGEQFPIDQTLANASTQLAAMNAMLAQGVAQVGGQGFATLPADAYPTVAVITGARQTNALMNHNPMIELDLLVTTPAGVPVPVRRTEVVQLLHLPRAQVGTRLAVRIDPRDPNVLAIDWAAPPPQ